MRYCNINIQDDTRRFKYIIEYKDDTEYNLMSGLHYSVKTFDDDLRVDFFDDTYQIARNDNYWQRHLNRRVIPRVDNLTEYIPQENGTPKVNISSVNLYFPTNSVEAYTNNNLYALTVNTWIHGHIVYLGTYIIDRRDSLACEREMKFMNTRYFEYVNIKFIDPWYLTYSDEWKDFRQQVCGEEEGEVELNNTGSVLNFTLYPVTWNEDRYIKLDPYIGGQNAINISDTVSDYIGCDLAIQQSQETGHEGEIDLLSTIHFNKSYSTEGVQTIQDLELYMAETYDVTGPLFIEYNLIVLDDDNIYKYVTKCSKDLQCVFTRDDLMFDNWLGWKEGLRFQATANIFTGIEPIPESRILRYTSTDGNVVDPTLTSSMPNIISNTYENGIGTIIFDDDLHVIGNSCFYEKNTLKTIEIPDSVGGIDSNAFFNSKLESIKLPSDLRYINNQAFYNCPLIDVKLPDTVTRISDFAFGNTGLFDARRKTPLKINLPQNEELQIGDRIFISIHNDYVEDITLIDTLQTSPPSNGLSGVVNLNYHGTLSGAPWGAAYLNKCVENHLVYEDDSKTELLYCTDWASGQIVVPDTISDVGMLFSGKSNITNLVLPDSIASFEEDAFSGVLNITYHGSATGAPWGAKYMNAYVEDNAVYSDETKTVLLGGEGYITIPESVVTILATSLSSGATISKLYNTYTKSGLFNSSCSVIIKSVASDTFDGDYNVNVLFSSGDSKSTKTFKVYTDDQTVYDQLINSTKQYTIFEMYHLDGTPW